VNSRNSRSGRGWEEVRAKDRVGGDMNQGGAAA
jgi:hypothetical protein